MLAKYVFIIGIVLLASCRPQLVRKNFTTYNKFDGNSHGLRLDGVYLADNNCDTCIQYFNCMVLYQNGFVSLSNLTAIESITPDSALNFLASFFKKRGKLFLHGAFTIDNNKNIILQHWEYSGHGDITFAKYDLFEFRGYILSDTSFVLTSGGSVGRQQYHHHAIFRFHHVASKPDSTNWMMLDNKLNRK